MFHSNIKEDYERKKKYILFEGIGGSSSHLFYRMQR